MKTVLKSLLTIAVVAVALVKTTGAYFTSNVTAADNEIIAGTLLLALDTAQNDTMGAVWGVDAWNVISENADGTYSVGSPFVDWTNAGPGDTYSYYIAVRSNGTIDMNARLSKGAASGWVAGPRFGTTLPDSTVCPATPAAGDASLVSVTNVHQYASENCEGAIGCENLYYSLTGGGWDHLNGLSAGDASLDAGYYYLNSDASGTQVGTDAVLGQNEFALYRVDVALDGPGTNNCYQGATYNLDVTANAKQPADLSW